MSQFVTKAEAMAFLHYDVEPPELTLLIEAGSGAVLDYLGEWATFADSSGDIDESSVPPVVKLATLIWMAEMDQNREGGETEKVDAQYGYGYPPAAVVRLLSRLRDPVMA
jgi:hypothetical protein